MKLQVLTAPLLLLLTATATTAAAASSSSKCPIYRIKSNSNLSWETTPGEGRNDCLVNENDSSGGGDTNINYIPASGNAIGVALEGTLEHQTAEMLFVDNNNDSKYNSCMIVNAAWKAGKECMEADYDSGFAIFDTTASHANGKQISHVELLLECCDDNPTTTSTTDVPPPPPLPPANLRTTTAGGYGDPHFLQWNGNIVDFHGACDLVLFSSSSSSTDQDDTTIDDNIDIHVRTALFDNAWSYIVAAAIRVQQDILEIAPYGHHMLNQQQQQSLPTTIGASGYPLKYTRLLASTHKYVIDLHGKGTIEVTAIDKFLSVMIRSNNDNDNNNNSKLLENSVGLTGQYQTGAALTRAGVVAANTNEYGMDWQVTTADPQLFSSIGNGPQWPKKCILPSVTATGGRRRQLLLSKEQAVEACAHWPAGPHQDSCIQDVMLTGVTDLAQVQVY